MKSPITIFIIIIVIVVFGIGAYTLSQNSSQSSSAVKNDDSVVTDEKMTDGIVGDPRYIEYSKTALDNVSGNRRVLFFYASWCPTCRPADADFKANADKISEDVRVIRVNYNDPETDQEEKDLAKKYGITYQHTFVQIDSQGNEVAKWNGGKTDELLDNIK